jgi:hypothetical protein
MPPPASDGGHNGPRGSSRHVWLISGFPHAFNDVLDLLFRSSFRHVDDHGLALLGKTADKKKRPRSWIAAAYGDLISF